MYVLYLSSYVYNKYHVYITNKNMQPHLQGELMYIIFGYPDLFITKWFENLMVYLRSKELTDLGRPDLIPVLKPTCRLGCKRLVFSSDFYQAIASPNASLVRSPIKEIKGKTIITEDGRMEEVDILVLATGYKTQEGVLGNIESKCNTTISCSSSSYL
jgi:cation diffusion facilitator CzcD-associated flavoprotein CzcO